MINEPLMMPGGTQNNPTLLDNVAASTQGNSAAVSAMVEVSLDQRQQASRSNSDGPVSTNSDSWNRPIDVIGHYISMVDLNRDWDIYKAAVAERPGAANDAAVLAGFEAEQARLLKFDAAFAKDDLVFAALTGPTMMAPVAVEGATLYAAGTIGARVVGGLMIASAGNHIVSDYSAPLRGTSQTVVSQAGNRLSPGAGTALSYGIDGAAIAGGLSIAAKGIISSSTTTVTTERLLLAPEEVLTAPGSLSSARTWTIKSRLNANNLPTTGKIRFVPERGYDPSAPLTRGPNKGFLDRFGNEWLKGPSRTQGQSFEWDVQLSRHGRNQLGWASRDGAHLNVSLDGHITHR
jgi:filamentous hemagglutinin